MKILCFCFMIVSSLSQLFSQCNEDYLFQIPLGITKFEAIGLVAKNPNLKLDPDASKYFYSSWEHYQYLPNDSFYLTSYYCEIIDEQCLYGKNKEMKMWFLNDVLYKIDITMDFSLSEVEECSLNFEIITNTFREIYAYESESVIYNTETNEKIGKGITFQPYKKFDSKVNDISVKYSLQKKLNKKLEFEQYYKFEVNKVNLNYTPLDARGY